MALINRSYKDRLFRVLFNNKEELLILYNALNNTTYTDASNLEVNTLEDSIYMGMKNDVSFIISDQLNLYEHQSTWNPNLPYRDLVYVTKIWAKHVKEKGFDIYGSRPIRLPATKAIVFYNGKMDVPERVEQKLSDLYSVQEEDVALEFKLTVLNINYGKNKLLMEKCKTLHDYSYFIARIRELLDETKDIRQAVDAAIDECIEKNILREFLLRERGKIMNWILTEYDEEQHIANEKRWSLEEGREEGEDRINRLYAFLLENNREDDMKRCLKDKEYRTELLKTL